ncbi:MAG: hypothetical protein M1838_001790 [Thelocarpon superellum]|nr:MAG: hypothetical protein M1838_001790 [Thelocarpon superellum]
MTEVDNRTDTFATRVEGLNSDSLPTTDPAVSPETAPRGASKRNNSTGSSDDPFAGQRTADNDPFTERGGSTSLSPPQSPEGHVRRMSKEWDASKVPPSRFQKREGSLYATPGSRDGHVSKNTQHAYAEKLKEKGWK